MSVSIRQRQEIPTHLEVEDRILFGLTLRQAVILLLGVAVGYFAYAQSGRLPWPGVGRSAADGHLPLALQIMVGVIPALCALLLAILQPAGRPLEDWLFAIVRYATLPKRSVWRSRAVHGQSGASGASGDAMLRERLEAGDESGESGESGEFIGVIARGSGRDDNESDEGARRHRTDH